MRRRDLLKSAGARVAALAAPADRAGGEGQQADFRRDLRSGYPRPGRYRRAADTQSCLSGLRHSFRHRYELDSAATDDRRSSSWACRHPVGGHRGSHGVSSLTHRGDDRAQARNIEPGALRDRARQLSACKGHSATADIEGVLIHGPHGARALSVMSIPRAARNLAH